MKSIYFGLIMAFSIHSPGYAEIYKWVDEDGNVHYTDRSLKNSKEMNISVDDAVENDISVDDRNERRQKLIDAMREDREEKERLKKEEQKRNRKLRKQCQWARDSLRNYEASGGIYNLDKEGKRVVLSDEERNKFINKLRSDIKKHCK